MPYKKFLILTGIVLLIIADNFAISEADEILYYNLLKTKYEEIIDYPDSKKVSWVKEENLNNYEWEYNLENLVKKYNNEEEGFFFLNRFYLYDSDVFYGRENIPEARSKPLFLGNNYNLTFNNQLLKSDDYVRREGNIRNSLSVIFKEKFNDFILKGDFTLKTGENLNSQNSFFKFNRVSLIKNNSFSMTVGEINPYFDELTLDKSNTPITGVTLNKKWAKTELEFVAARPDIPLEFGYESPDSVIIDVDKWQKNKPYIYYFNKPYNYFDFSSNDLPVFVYAYRNNEVINITDDCIINHSEVIIPESLMNSDFKKIKIEYDQQGKNQQLTYLNAFKVDRKIGENTKLELSYVDLHNDTHSVTNLSSSFAPFDSNIWNLSFKTKISNLKIRTKVYQSKIIPDDYEYNRREVDYIYNFKAAYSADKVRIGFEYSWLGADYLLNVISLTDKWKLIEDSNADFRWDYQNKFGELGNEVYKFKCAYGNDIKQEINAFYKKNLVSNYKQSEYAKYDRFYLPYYSNSGDEYRLYGEGVDDGKKTVNLNYNLSIYDIIFALSYKKVDDEKLYISPLKKDYSIYGASLMFVNSNLNIKTSYESKNNFVYYSPSENNFVKQQDDNTFKIKFNYKNKTNIYKGFYLKLDNEFKYVNDADSIYQNKDWFFKNFIIEDMDYVDSDFYKNRLYTELLYQFDDKNYISVYYDYEILNVNDAISKKSLDYKKTIRGIKYYNNFGIEDIFLVAFYDENELFFDSLNKYNYTRKDIGALIQIRF